MKKWISGIAIAASLVLASQISYANELTYTTSAAFGAATNVLLTQTFGGVATNLGVGVGSILPTNDPLNNTTNSAILPGLEIRGQSGAPGDLFVAGPNADSTGLANYSVFGNATPLLFYFGPNVTAVSFGLLSEPDPISVGIIVVDPSFSVLGIFAAGANNTGTGQFWGTTVSGDTIGAIGIFVPGSGSEFVGVDQVQFGTAMTPEPSPLILIGTALIALLAFSRTKALQQN